MLRSLVLCALVASCSAFVATPMLPQRSQIARSAPISTQMVVEPSSIDAATQLMALQIPIPAYSPAKVRLAPAGGWSSAPVGISLRHQPATPITCHQH